MLTQAIFEYMNGSKSSEAARTLDDGYVVPPQTFRNYYGKVLASLINKGIIEKGTTVCELRRKTKDGLIHIKQSTIESNIKGNVMVRSDQQKKAMNAKERMANMRERKRAKLDAHVRAT